MFLFLLIFVKSILFLICKLNRWTLTVVEYCGEKWFHADKVSSEVYTSVLFES